MWTLLLSRVNEPGVYLDRRQLDGGELRVGRSADKADWVIADPEGHLSRHHCTIAAIGLDLFVIDVSTNGVALNHAGGRVAPQQPVPIRVRDRLLLGDHIIEVATEGAGAGIALQPAPPPLPAAASSGLTQPDIWFDGGGGDAIWGVGAPSQEVHDFLGNAMHNFLAPPASAGFGGAADPWAGPMSDAFSKPILAPMMPVESAFSIPEDWAAPPASAAASTAPFGAPAQPSADPFGGGVSADLFAATARPSADPFGSPSAVDPFAPPGEAAADPFAGFAPAGGSPFAEPLHDPFAPAPGAFAGGGRLGGADPFALPGTPAAIDPFDLSAPLPAPDAFADAAPAARPQAFDDRLPPPTIDAFADYAPAATSDPLAGFAETPATVAPAPPPASGSGEAGWAAFCEGAGLTPEEMRGSPDAMRRMGALYRQVVLGLTDLIQDRAAFKDEFRVERTQLSFGKNNPFKHLPALESAKLLLGDPLPGFMPADDAVRSAFEDVKKHQLAMLAGVQHALTAVFERLAPAEIKRIMKKAAGERKGLPFGRGVNPWTVYQTIFDALRLDAASNVNSVMSVAFREGYEAFLKNAKS